MEYAAQLICFARAIFVTLEQGRIVDTIVHGLFTPLANLPLALAALGMMVVHALVHVPVPSPSGHAVLTLPILVPLADLLACRARSPSSPISMAAASASCSRRRTAPSWPSSLPARCATKSGCASPSRSCSVSWRWARVRSGWASRSGFNRLAQPPHSSGDVMSRPALIRSLLVLLSLPAS